MLAMSGGSWREAGSLSSQHWVLKKKIQSSVEKKKDKIIVAHIAWAYMFGAACFTWIITSFRLLSPLWRFYYYPWGKQGSEGEITSPSSRGCGGIPIWSPSGCALEVCVSVPSACQNVLGAPQKSLCWHHGTIDCQLRRAQSLSWLVPSDPRS